MTDRPDVAKRDVPTLLGLAVIAVAAIIMSFTALSDLARMCGRTEAITVGPVTLRVAWLLPVALDTLAAVAIRMRRAGAASPDVARYASRVVWAAAGASVGGGAYHGYLVQAEARPPWLVAALVSGVGAVAIGVAVHLSGLLGQGPGEAGESRATSPGRITRWRAASTAWWEMRKAESKAADARRAGAGETGRTAGGPTVPTGSDSNDVLAADLRRLNAGRQAKGEEPLKRDAVRNRYRGIGSTRADTVRAMAARPEPTDGLHVVPHQEEATG